MRVTRNYHGLELSKTDIDNLTFALNVLEQDIGSRGDKSEDLKAKKGFLTVKEIAFRLGVDYNNCS